MYELITRAKANLRRAIEDTARTKHLPHTGERWEAYAAAVRDRYEELVTPLEAIHFAQDPRRHRGFESRDTKEKLDDTIEVHETMLFKLFPQFAQSIDSFAESQFSDPRSITVARGRFVSKPMYAHAHFVMKCLSYDRSDTIVEFGGGYGAAARLWMTNAIHTPKLYCDIDLPESLFFAENFLGLHFGAESVVYLHGEEDLDLLSRPAVKFVLCPTHAAQWLYQRGFDLAWNSNSMPEMSEGYVDFYMNWLDLNRPKYFYSCNTFGYDLLKMDENVNFIAPVPSKQWRALLLETHGTRPLLAAEMMFRIEPEWQATEAELDDLLAHELTPESYLRLIDATRSANSSAFIWRIIQKVQAEWDYLPKEVVHLCRQIELIDACPSPTFDEFRDKVNGIVDANSRGRVSPHLLKDPADMEADPASVPSGILERSPDMTRATIGGETYEISSDYFGAIEQLTRQSNATIAYGWAADTKKRSPVTAIYGFSGNALVVMAKPVYERDDIVTGWGEWCRMAGFRLRLPETDEPWDLVALSEAGRAGWLSPTFDKANGVVDANLKGRVSTHLVQDPTDMQADPASMPSGILEMGPEIAHATIGGKTYEITSDYFGAVEQLIEQSNSTVAYGWAADTRRRSPVTAIYVFSGNALVGMAKPVYERDDIVTGWGEWCRMAGFQLRLPETDEQLDLVALSEAGRAGWLSPTFDGFRNKVDGIVDANPSGRVSTHLVKDPADIEADPASMPSGILERSADMTRATIGGKTYEISPDYFGIVEQLTRQSNATIAYGWAADTKKPSPVTAIYGFSGNALVVMAKPVYERDDIVAGWGECCRMAGFRLRLPVAAEQLGILALSEAGRAGWIKI
jgi:putative sugar O-methyltransferase